MSEMNSSAIDVIVQAVIDAVDKRLGSASFDKSQTGVVTAVNGNEYTIAAFGSKYTITSDQVFTVGQSVIVTAIQGDMKRLVCSPDNVGTLNTVNSQVKTVDDRLTKFINTDYTSTLNQIDKIQGQVDRSFMSWFYAGEPTVNNPPAEDWTTDDAKQLHVGDLYYDTENGYSYEWVYQNNVYGWSKVSDSGIQEALKAASTAQDTADKKRRTFYSEEHPNPPYDAGDLWSQGSSGDLKVANRSRTINEKYSAFDWDPASKYTDDTAAKNAQQDVDNLTKRTSELETDYSDTKESVGVLKTDVGDLQTTVATHDTDIAELKKNVATHASAIMERPTTNQAKNYAKSAQDAATTAAASDATTKANAAKESANQYTDEQVKTLSDRIVVLENAIASIREQLGQ